MSSNAKRVAREIEKFSNSLHATIKGGLRKVASHAYKKLILETPKGYTGQTRKSWYLKQRNTPKRIGYTIGNSSKIMKYLEDGTKAHGPKRAKFLFVPLNKTATLKGITKRAKYGKSYVFAKKVKGIKALNIVKKRSTIVERQATLMIKKIMDKI